MKHNPVGNTGISLPSIIFGTSALGNLYSALSDETKTAIVSECLKHVSPPVVFDSAGKYGAGLALEKLGEILARLNVPEGEVLISNKLGWTRQPLKGPEPEFEKGVWVDIRNDARQEISYDGIMKCLEQGNELLGGKFAPQLVSVHDPDEYIAAAGSREEEQARFRNIADAYSALSDLKAAGRVKAIGVGAKDWKTVRRITDSIDLDWVMIANSLTIYKHPPELLRFVAELHSRGIAIINSAVFHAGFLTGGVFFDYVPVKPGSPGSRELFRWRDEFFSVCKKHGIPPAFACVQFALTPPGVVSISLNTSNPDRVRQNVDSVEFSMPAEFWRDMRSKKLIADDYPYI